jgi:hypothetical protein
LAKWATTKCQIGYQAFVEFQKAHALPFGIFAWHRAVVCGENGVHQSDSIEKNDK